MSDPIMNPEFLTDDAPRWWEWLFTPFRYIAGGTALVVGLIAILLAGLLGSFTGTHFSGVLDMHPEGPAPLWVFMVEGPGNWAILTIILLAFGKLISGTAFRAIDLIGTQAMARWPTVLCAAAALLPGFRRATAAFLAQAAQGARIQVAPADLISFAFVGLVVVGALIWMIALMWQSYRVCCNLRGVPAVISFIIGLLAAEIMSRLLFLALLKQVQA